MVNHKLYNHHCTPLHFDHLETQEIQNGPSLAIALIAPPPPPTILITRRQPWIQEREEMLHKYDMIYHMRKKNLIYV